MRIQSTIVGVLGTWTMAGALAYGVTKGPDAGGYTGTDVTVFSFSDISGAGGGAGVLAGIDDGTAVLNLPFAFRFYGQNYTLACASSNGALYFISAASACNGLIDFANTDLTVAGPPGDLPALLPFWSDLTFQVPGAGSVLYTTLGPPGNRRFIVQWNNAYPQGSPNPVTFQVVLFESNSQVLFQYQTVSLGAGNPATNGARATIGVRNQGGKANGQQLPWSFDAPVVTDRAALMFAGGAATVTSVSNAQGQYSDVVQLSATVSGGNSATGSVAFQVNGSPAGSATVNSNGIAKLAYTIGLGANSYTIAAQFTGTGGFLNSSGSGTLTVTREDAVVTPAASNPASVAVTVPGGKSGSITLKAAITEASDGSPGDTSKAVPVTFTLTPAGGGAPISCTASTTGGGIGQAITASCAFSGLAVNIYNVSIAIGGAFYTGSAQSTLAVVDPSLGFTTGGGTVVHSSVNAQFQFDFKYQGAALQGSLVYSEARPAGAVTLTSTSSVAMAIIGNRAIIYGAATLNNVPGYTYQLTVIDNGKPGNDQIALQVTAPNGAVVADLTFAPLTLTGGNLQVHQ